ncbi:DUF2922 domain-containing protein [Bacillus sp. 1P02SD]|uniref:DUF2922 domain-containing protein n=1 Tax=Bacillus sp. 1P02SD TaxID=3132264 RepID=UPI0039A3877A
MLILGTSSVQVEHIVCPIWTTRFVFIARQRSTVLYPVAFTRLLAAVSTAMDLIISTNVFLTPGGAIVEKKGARVVERNVETVEM